MKKGKVKPWQKKPGKQKIADQLKMLEQGKQDREKAMEKYEQKQTALQMEKDAKALNEKYRGLTLPQKAADLLNGLPVLRSKT